MPVRPTLFGFFPYHTYMDQDKITFETLYSDYIKRMTAFVSTFRNLGDAEIEDLAHDILVHAWFKKDRYDGTRSLNAWIYALARNYVIDYLRSKQIVSVPLDERKHGKDTMGANTVGGNTRFDSRGNDGAEGSATAAIGDSEQRAESIQSEDSAEYADSELTQLIKKEIGTMDARDRQIAMLIFFEHMSGAETSRVMGIPGATVRWRLAAIRKKLQKICREAQ